FDECIRLCLSARQDGRVVIAHPHARYYGTELGERTLVRGADPRLGGIGLEDWLARSAVHAVQAARSRRPAPGVGSVVQGEARCRKRETVSDDTQGVQLATMQELVHYWGTEYDFRRFEARLNALPQFITEIDGLDIHFIQVKSPHANALPLIITHGWPGSVIEMLNVAGLLADPAAHG